jgi:hypothetical protein
MKGLRQQLWIFSNMIQCKIIQTLAPNNVSEAAMSLACDSEVPYSRFNQVTDYFDRHFIRFYFIIFVTCKWMLGMFYNCFLFQLFHFGHIYLFCLSIWN